MPIARIWADTIGQARCKGPTCGARITWAELVGTGKRMCFNGELVALKIAPEKDTGRQVWYVDLSTNHWATCPDRERFVKNKGARG